jgi:hypothetical protein
MQPLKLLVCTARKSGFEEELFIELFEALSRGWQPDHLACTDVEVFVVPEAPRH